MSKYTGPVYAGAYSSSTHARCHVPTWAQPDKSAHMCFTRCATCRAVRLLREELQLLQEPGSYVGEVVKVMGKTKVLCKVHPEGKYVVDLDKVNRPLDISAPRRVARAMLSCLVVHGGEPLGCFNMLPA
jgi:ATP-dependent 26S proteasome regulatory subunit